jgi:amino acid transporter
LMGGILIAYFMYSGWDAAIYVNEETKDRVNSPGKAAVTSVAMLAVVYSITTFAFQGVLSPDELQAHAGNALSAIGARVLHKPWDSLMALVVLTGTLASLQAAVVSAARMGFAMSRDRVMPEFFRRVRKGGTNPWAATLTMSAINLILLALSLGTTSVAGALTNAASSLGLISIVFYGITAAAALRQQWATMTSSPKDWIVGGLLPFLGVSFSLWVLIESLLTGAVTNIVMLYGLGSIMVGAGVAVFLHRFKNVRFFAAFDSARSPAAR